MTWKNRTLIIIKIKNCSIQEQEGDRKIVLGSQKISYIHNKMQQPRGQQPVDFIEHTHSCSGKA